jgi:hypothetical protein
MLRKIYLGFGTLIIVVYGWLAFTGWEPGTPAREKLPRGARAGTGFRSYHVWHSSYWGGK